MVLLHCHEQSRNYTISPEATAVTQPYAPVPEAQQR